MSSTRNIMFSTKEKMMAKFLKACQGFPLHNHSFIGYLRGVLRAQALGAFSDLTSQATTNGRQGQI
jgi:hypothetical protein